MVIAYHTTSSLLFIFFYCFIYPGNSSIGLKLVLNATQHIHTYIHVHQFSFCLRLLAKENKVFMSALTSALDYPTMVIHVYFKNAV